MKTAIYTITILSKSSTDQVRIKYGSSTDRVRTSTNQVRIEYGQVRMNHTHTIYKRILSYIPFKPEQPNKNIKFNYSLIYDVWHDCLIYIIHIKILKYESDLYYTGLKNKLNFRDNYMYYNEYWHAVRDGIHLPSLMIRISRL